MEINTDFGCCALGEINGISRMTSKLVIQAVIADFVDNCLYEGGDDGDTGEMDLLDELKNEVKPILLFTGAKRGKRGIGPKYSEALANFIDYNKLGTVETSEPVFNPNSGSYVTLYVWKVDYPGLLKYAKATNK